MYYAIGDEGGEGIVVVVYEYNEDIQECRE